MIDVPRLRKELEFITAHRERWLQNTWVSRTECGTVGCLAGNIVLNAGYRPFYDADRDSTSYVRDGERSSTNTYWIRDLATSILGLTERQADDLFRSSNTLYELWWIASELTHGEIQVPADVEPTSSWYHRTGDAGR
jgi:hypothetical protein